MFHSTACLIISLLLIVRSFALGGKMAPPNILVFLMDDMGIGDSRVYNKNSKVSVPIHQPPYVLPLVNISKSKWLTVADSIHGLALQPLFSNESNFPWRKDILYQYFDGGTPEERGPYNMPRHEGIRDERYKLISFYEFNQWEFYDLENDPKELNNLFKKKQFKPEIKRLQQRLLCLKDHFFKND